MYKIMIIDDNAANLTLARIALEKQYNVQPVLSGKKALEVLSQATELPNLILLDIEMPDMNGFDVIKAVKSIPKLSSIPVIFLTADNNAASELHGLSLGALDYIFKPFSPMLLNKRVELHLKMLEQQKSLENYNKNLERLVEEKTRNVIRLQYTIIYSIADLIGKKDGYTGGHTDRVGIYVGILLNRIIHKKITDSIKQTEIPAIALSAKLHDVGKIAVPDAILLKKGKLEPYEFEIIKTHTSVGCDSILRSMMTPEEFAYLMRETGGDMRTTLKMVRESNENEFLRFALDMARSHHEKWNGRGYPDGLAGGDIPLIARITAVADVYDALRSVRPYKASYSHKESVEIIRKDSGISFDPVIADVFLDVECEFEAISNSMQVQQVGAAGA